MSVAPGGSIDILARELSGALSKSLGQPFNVESKSTRGGNAAFEFVAKAAPDGYTFLVGWDPLVINPRLYPSSGYDPRASFAPVGQTSLFAQALAVAPKSPDADVRAFLARAGGGEARVGIPGGGGMGRLALDLIEQAGEIKTVHSPYRGAAPAIAELDAGNVDAVIVGLPAVLERARAGTLRVLAVSSLERSAALPSVPTLVEAGLPGAVAVSWQGLLAPAGTPDAIIRELNRRVVEALSRPAARDRMAAAGFQVAAGTPERLGDIIASEVEKWARLVERGVIRAD
jgi:tripartite-type tricarboxylate transporter receptor subunit TctC